MDFTKWICKRYNKETIDDVIMSIAVQHGCSVNGADEIYCLVQEAFERGYKEGWKTGGDPFTKPKGL